MELSYQRATSADLELLVSDAKRRGVTRITLDSTPMGRSLYERFGFVSMPAEMELSYKA